MAQAKAIPLDMLWLSAYDFNQYSGFVSFRGRMKWSTAAPLPDWAEGAAADWAHVIAAGTYMYWAWAQLDLALSQPGTWTVEDLSVVLTNNMGQGLVPLAASLDGRTTEIEVPDTYNGAAVSHSNRFPAASGIAQGSGFFSLGEGFYTHPSGASSPDLPAYVTVTFYLRAPDAPSLPPGEQDHIVQLSSWSMMTARPLVEAPPPPRGSVQGSAPRSRVTRVG